MVVDYWYSNDVWRCLIEIADDGGGGGSYPGSCSGNNGSCGGGNDGDDDVFLLRGLAIIYNSYTDSLTVSRVILCHA